MPENLPSYNQVLVRWYYQNGRPIKTLQGKVIKVNDQWIYYRDLWEHKGRMWKEAGGWNIDYRTLLWLKLHSIKQVHYFWHKDNKLYITTVNKIFLRLKSKELKVEKIGGHRQVFLPKTLFKQTEKNYTVAWVKPETDVSKAERQIIEDYTIPLDVRFRLAEIWRQTAWLKPA